MVSKAGIISISWGINAPEDGGLSRLPHIIEKIPKPFTDGLPDCGPAGAGE
jgi:hypothetical protein